MKTIYENKQSRADSRDEELIEVWITGRDAPRYEISHNEPRGQHDKKRVRISKKLYHDWLAATDGRLAVDRALCAALTGNKERHDATPNS